MKKRVFAAVFGLYFLMISITSCSRQELVRYDAQFLQLFDTVTSIVGYAKDKDTFTKYAQLLYDELKIYHELYDIYNDYEGVNNIKTINDHAGIEPVVVDQKIIDMLDFSKEMYQQTNGRVNVAMGSVLSIWHEYRTDGTDDPEHAKIPPMELLEEANKHTDINKIVIDYEASTVYLSDPDMSLDVGAIAKGYAAEQVSQTLEKKGLKKALISVGGNVRAIGTKEGGEKWKVGIQNPDLSSQQNYLHTVSVEDQSLVTSGAYQRYYTVDGVQYHHIIHPDLLMPWNEYESVSILCHDSGVADALSTAVFNMSLEDGMDMIENIDQAEAMWILPDKSEYYTSGFMIDKDSQ